MVDTGWYWLRIAGWCTGRGDKLSDKLSDNWQQGPPTPWQAAFAQRSNPPHLQLARSTACRPGVLPARRCAWFSNQPRRVVQAAQCCHCDELPVVNCKGFCTTDADMRKGAYGYYTNMYEQNGYPNRGEFMVLRVDWWSIHGELPAWVVLHSTAPTFIQIETDPYWHGRNMNVPTYLHVKH